MMKYQTLGIMVMSGLFWFFSNVSGQSRLQEYHTLHGRIQISGQVGDSILQIEGDQTNISLNYETAEVRVLVNKKLLSQNFSENNGVLRSGIYNEVLFEGKLGLDYVITHNHPLLNFQVDGFMISGNEKKPVSGSGSLEHINADEYACILTLEFEVMPEVLGINWPGNHPVKVLIYRSVLKRALE